MLSGERPARCVQWCLLGIERWTGADGRHEPVSWGRAPALDVLEHGYWHARSPAFLRPNVVQMIEWLRLPGEAILIGAGVVPAVIAAALTYRSVRRASR